MFQLNAIDRGGKCPHNAITLLFDIVDDPRSEFVRVHLALVVTAAVRFRNETGVRIPCTFQALLRTRDAVVSTQNHHGILP